MLIPSSRCRTLTLLPAMLAVLGPRINSIRVMPRRFIDQGHPEDGAWGRWARFVLRRPSRSPLSAWWSWPGSRVSERS